MDEPVLDEYYQGPSGRHTMRTSRHSPARRRENSNRASNAAIAWLLLRAVLIVVLLGGGYWMLQFIVARVSGPSEKDQQRWEANAALMDGATADEPGEEPAVPAPSRTETLSDELIEKRLEQWMLAERHLRSADALVRRGIRDQAVERLSLALHASPENYAAQKQLMELYLSMDAYAEAIPLCIRLLDQGGEQWEIQLNLLRALEKSGRFRASLMLAERLLELQPENRTVLNSAAASCLALGDADRALSLYDLILTRNSRDRDALLGAAEIHRARGAWQQAIPYYLELVRIEPSDEVYYALALCYAQQTDAGKAVVFMGQAASLYGESAVSPWLRDSGFDIIREEVEFRSFADRIIGIENRKAIEAISRREAEKTTPEPAGGMDLPQQPELNALKPSR